MGTLVRRLSEDLLKEVMRSFRVAIVNGPRQAGKSTLLTSYIGAAGGELVSLDDQGMLDLAFADPISFIQHRKRPFGIDEVQLGGDRLVRAVKLAADRDNTPGRFILSGSSRFLTVPTLSESLAGRAAFIDLWPFAMAERANVPADFCDGVFDNPAELLASGRSGWDRDSYLDLFCTGGFPDVVNMRSARTRQLWFDSYLTTVTTRDVTEFAQVRQPAALLSLVELVGARAGSLMSIADLARSAGLSPTTAQLYLSYLETVFLTISVPAWSTNLTSKISKAPKVYLTDSGLHAHAVRVTPSVLRKSGHPAFGGLVESFVLTELLRLRSLSRTSFDIYHLRNRESREIDFLLESRDGRIVAIEVKGTVSPRNDDFRHLRWLREKLGDQMVAGILFYLGDQTLSARDGILAVPVSAMWHHAEPAKHG